MSGIVSDGAISTDDGVLEQYGNIKNGVTDYTAEARVDRLLAMVYND